MQFYAKKNMFLGLILTTLMTTISTNSFANTQYEAENTEDDYLRYEHQEWYGKKTIASLENVIKKYDQLCFDEKPNPQCNTYKDQIINFFSDPSLNARAVDYLVERAHPDKDNYSNVQHGGYLFFTTTLLNFAVEGKEKYFSSIIESPAFRKNSRSDIIGSVFQDVRKNALTAKNKKDDYIGAICELSAATAWGGSGGENEYNGCKIMILKNHLDTIDRVSQTMSMVLSAHE